MKKKVLFFIPTLGHGGAEKVLVNLVNNLDKSKFDITVQTIFSDGVNQEFLNQEIRYISIFKKIFRGFSHLFKLLTPTQLHTLFIKEKYDIEIAFLEAVSTRIISGCKNKNTTLIAWVHCTMHDKKEAQIGYRNWNESVIAYAKYDKIICVSNDVKNAFNHLYHKSSNTLCIYNINESDMIRKLSKASTYGTKVFDSKVFNICAVGKIIDIKGFDRLARIQKKLIAQNYSTHIYVLGVGEKQKEISEYVYSVGIQDSWTFLGYKKNPYEWIANCDLFVCSSQSEGLSTAVTEALLIGVPIITTDVSGMRELLENGQSGMIVKNDDSSLLEGIKILIENPLILNHLRNEAMRRGNDFSKEKIMSRVEEVLLEFEEVPKEVHS